MTEENEDLVVDVTEKRGDYLVDEEGSLSRIKQAREIALLIFAQMESELEERGELGDAKEILDICDVGDKNETVLHANDKEYKIRVDDVENLEFDLNYRVEESK